VDEQRKWKGLSIKQKVILLITGVSFLALTVSGAMAVTFEWLELRKAMVRELTIQAEIIGSSSVVTLSFDGLSLDLNETKEAILVTSMDARETLDTFRVNEHILSAGIYSRSGGRGIPGDRPGHHRPRRRVRGEGVR